ncbi:hypothetical protein, partial [Parvularcula maris]
VGILNDSAFDETALDRGSLSPCVPAPCLFMSQSRLSQETYQTSGQASSISDHDLSDASDILAMVVELFGHQYAPLYQLVEEERLNRHRLATDLAERTKTLNRAKVLKRCRRKR